MKRRIAAMILAGAIALSLTGCGKGRDSAFDKTNHGIFLNANLSVSDMTIEEFDTDKYDLEEFTGYLNEDVKKYADTHEYEKRYTSDGEEDLSVPAALSVERCDVKSKEIMIQLRYASCADFLEYNKEVLPARGGDILECGLLSSAPDSVVQASFLNEKGEVIDIQQIFDKGKADDYRYMVCNIESTLFGEGDVFGYTANGEFRPTDDGVSVPAGETVMVLFK